MDRSENCSHCVGFIKYLHHESVSSLRCQASLLPHTCNSLFRLFRHERPTRRLISGAAVSKRGIRSCKMKNWTSATGKGQAQSVSCNTQNRHRDQKCPTARPRLPRSIGSSRKAAPSELFELRYLLHTIPTSAQRSEAPAGCWMSRGPPLTLTHTHTRPALAHASADRAYRGLQSCHVGLDAPEDER